MTEFKDANGRTWRIKLTIDAIDAINVIINKGRGNAPAIDLLEVADASGKLDVELFRNLFTSPRRMQAILVEAIDWDSGDSQETKDLGDGLREGAIEAAFAAFFDELSYFFPESQRPVIKTLLGSYNEAANKMGRIAADMLENTMRDSLGASVSLEPAAT